MPARRATNETDIPGCMVSSTSRTFSAVVQRRRRCTEGITSTRDRGAEGSDDIVIIIGLCLCLIELCRLSGQNGVRSMILAARTWHQEQRCQGLSAPQFRLRPRTPSDGPLLFTGAYDISLGF